MNNNTNKGVLLKGVRRIAEYYQSSTRSIQELINAGVIPTYRIGRNRYAYSNEIDAALLDRKEAKNERAN